MSIYFLLFLPDDFLFDLVSPKTTTILQFGPFVLILCAPAGAFNERVIYSTDSDKRFNSIDSRKFNENCEIKLLPFFYFKMKMTFNVDNLPAKTKSSFQFSTEWNCRRATKPNEKRKANDIKWKLHTQCTQIHAHSHFILQFAEG